MSSFCSLHSQDFFIIIKKKTFCLRAWRRQTVSHTASLTIATGETLNSQTCPHIHIHCVLTGDLKYKLLGRVLTGITFEILNLTPALFKIWWNMIFFISRTEKWQSNGKDCRYDPWILWLCMQARNGWNTDVNTQAGDAQSSTLSFYSNWDQSPSMNNLSKLTKSSSNSDLLLERIEKRGTCLHCLKYVFNRVNKHKKMFVCLSTEWYISLSLFMHHANQFCFFQTNTLTASF